VRWPGLRGIVTSVVLHVSGVALAVILLREPVTSALFIDLTRDDSPVDGGSALLPAAASPPPSAASARRGQATRPRARSSVASVPSAITPPAAGPPVPRSAAATAPPSAAVPAPPPVEFIEHAAAASPATVPVPPPLAAPAAPDANPSPAPSAAPGAAPAAAGDAPAGGSDTGSASTTAGLATSAVTSSSAGTGGGNATSPSDGGAVGQTALAVTGDGGRAGAEYGAYLALVRRRIQESLRYPMTARRRGLSGSVHVEITVAPNGTIAAVSVVGSSSHPLLDEAAVDAVRRLPPMPFPPGVTPRSLRVRLPVVFELR